MRKFLAGMAAISLLLVASASAGDGADNPEEAVEGFLNAMKTCDAEAIVEYLPAGEDQEFTDEDLEELEEELEGMSDMMSEMEFDITGSEVEGDNATVTAELTIMGQLIEEEYEVMKQNGKWVMASGLSGGS